MNLERISIYIFHWKKITKQHVWNELIVIKTNHMYIFLLTYVYIFKNTRLNTKIKLVFIFFSFFFLLVEG